MGLIVAPGTQVVVRDEEWLVRAVSDTMHDGQKVEVTGVSELVRDTDAVFFTGIDEVEPLDPAATRLVADETPGFRRSRLWLEALLRRTPLPLDETRIAVGHRALLDELNFQRRPAEVALGNLRPRVLIADAVGLGKTLEIGIMLAELIKRGRGERILVVTPRAVLEQFQHELWTRFAIPLVRLDSEGIQRVRQKLPASRNPFSFYRRVIVSIDTLKNPARYRHHLAGHRWDVVVIDECHNLINRGTQNNELARLLAAHTDALILASATPHNGRAESFAELVGLLDPTAIADPSDYTGEDIAHLYVRRHRNSDDVRLEVAHNWKARRDTEVRWVTPRPAEAAVLEELEQVWLHPRAGSAPVHGSGRSLLPWTLFKAFLSSTPALRSTVSERLRRLPETDDARAERNALHTLDELAAKAADGGSAKLEALVEHCRDIGVGPGSPTRVVVFSERVHTLHWLRAELPARLGLPADAVALMHSQLPDAELQRTVEEFALGSAPVRVLLASDMASEGINLHRQCHHLVHFDLPWSLIRIQQRNGRIDRYMQLAEPRITALALASDNPDIASDLRVLTTLLRKEHRAYLALGDAAALMHVHDEEIEESKVREVLQHRRDIEEVVPDPEPAKLDPFEEAITLSGGHATEPPPALLPDRSLFDSDAAFLAEALAEVAERTPQDDYDLREEPDIGLVAFEPPDDLRRRLGDLPDSYLRERQVMDRLRVTTARRYAEQSLSQARENEDMLWPEVHYLAPQHPVLEWVTDRALARLGRNEAPVLAGTVPGPVFLTQAVWSNHRGQPVILHWGAVTGLPGDPQVGEALAALQAAGIRSGAVNPGVNAERIEPLRALLPAALAACRSHLDRLRDDRREALRARLAEQSARLDRWVGRAEQLTLDIAATARRDRRRRWIGDVRTETEDLIRSLSTSGEPLVRVVGVIVPRER